MSHNDFMIQKELAVLVSSELIRSGKYMHVGVMRFDFTNEYELFIVKKAFGENHNHKINLAIWLEDCRAIGLQNAADLIVHDIDEKMSDDAIKDRILNKLGV